MLLGACTLLLHKLYYDLVLADVCVYCPVTSHVLLAYHSCATNAAFQVHAKNIQFSTMTLNEAGALPFTKQQCIREHTKDALLVKLVGLN
jgi:hypothetical protein